MTIKFLHSPPRVSLSKSANQSYANDAGLTFLSSVQWDVEDSDDFGFHAGTSVNVIVSVSGLYFVQTKIWFQGSAAGARYIRLTKNGATNLGYTRLLDTGGAANVGLSLAMDVPLIEGDSVQVQPAQNSGGALNVLGGSNDLSMFQMRWVAQS